MVAGSVVAANASIAEGARAARRIGLRIRMCGASGGADVAVLIRWWERTMGRNLAAVRSGFVLERVLVGAPRCWIRQDFGCRGLGGGGGRAWGWLGPYPCGMSRGGQVVAGRAVLVSLVVSLSLWACPAGAWGQQREYRLGDEGWTVAREPEAGSDEAEIAEIRRLIAERRPNAARLMAKQFIESRRFSQSPWLPEAHLLKGDALVLRGDEYRALREYEEIIREYPGSEMFVRALERELEIATLYVNGFRRKAFGLRIANARDVGEEFLVLVQERLPGSRLAERAALELGDYYYRVRDMRAAAEMYDVFLVSYPRSEHRQQAMRRRIFANIARFKGPQHDASGLIEARFLIEEYMRLYPADAEQSGLGDALLARLDESAAAGMLETGRWYLRTGDEVSARFMLMRLINRHPRTVAAARADQLLDARDLRDPVWLRTSDGSVSAAEEPDPGLGEGVEGAP
ncbi:MAG: outer membrane protein assembly factor BamD [Phycisphaerales bacterium]|nr:MAG: outer membrane protein assembly factor BamD [Phycisphaerales bacterium]